MRLLSAQPDCDYYIWQLEVQCNNFKKYDLEKNMLILIGYDKEKGININAKNFALKTNAKVFFIADTRIDKTYIPSIRPHIIKKFYKQNNIKESIFYHDSDIIFLSKPNFDQMLNKSNMVLLSDTISYIGGNYVKSKSEKLLDEMCDIVGIDIEVVLANEINSGGAQYLFNTVLDFEFWNKVEIDSTELYKLMQNTSHIYTPEHPIQSWCADMWGVLWNIWLRGIETKICDELTFCFATDKIKDKENVPIFHNAGVTFDMKNFFFKGNYIDKSPYDVDHSYVDKKYCSYLYVQEILETGIYNKRQ
jgi:predicted 3-demethylubiquinone-9 3-methyltransferase (glyoxalase superfamily)